MNVVHHGATTRVHVVSSPDLIWRIYRLQYNAPPLHTILKVICAGVGFGSGTETRVHDDIIFIVHLLSCACKNDIIFCMVITLAVDQVVST